MAILRLLATLTLGITVSSGITFTAGAPTPSNSTLVANPNTTVANGTASIPLTFTAVDYNGNLAPGIAVTISASGGNNTFGASSGTTNASGVFATTLTSTYAQTEVITASFGTSSSVTTIVQFVPGTASSATSSLVVNPNSQIADNSNTITASLTLKDAKGNAIANVTPNFTASGTSTTVSSAPVTSASGQTSATYQTTLAQNENALVTAGGLSFIAPMVFVPGPPAAAASTLTANPNIAAGNGSAVMSLVATARDAQGNVVSGASVSLSASGGNNTFAAANGNTTTSGIYTTTLKSTSMQTQTVTALIAGNFNETVSVTFTGNANATTSSLVVNPNTQTVGPGNLITATLVLRDAASNPLASVTPTWTGSGSANTIASAGATSSSGVATATYSSTLAQSESVTVSAGGAALSQPVSFTAGPPNATTSYFYAIPTHQLANNANTIVGTVMLFDAYNNPASGQVVTFSASGSSTSASGPSTTNSAGLAQGVFQSGVVQNENMQASASGVNFSTPVFFTGIPAQCSLSASPSSQTPNANNKIALTAFVSDSNNQPLANILTSFSSTGSANLFSTSSAVSTAAGYATSTVSSVFSGNDTFLAQAQNVQCSAQGSYQTQTAYCAGNPNYSATPYAATNPWNIVVADFNSDGTADFAVANVSKNTIFVYLNTGSGAFQSASVLTLSSRPQSLTVGDFNHDGNPDLAAATNGSATAIFLGTGSGGFFSPVYYPMSSVGFGVATADFNGDGVLDIATGIQSGTVAISIGNGLGSFQRAVEYTANGSVNYIALGDFNGDGIVDVAVANYTPKQLSVLLGTGNGGLRAPVTYATGGYTSGVSVGDLNGDGILDIVTSRNDGAMNVFLGTGLGTFPNRVDYNVGANLQYPLITDINGDGIPDVVAGDNSGSLVFFLVGSANGTLALQSATLSGYYPKHMAAGDFNGDGKQDLLVGYANNPGVYVYLNLGCH